MGLAAALHHSAQRPKTVVEEPKEEVENVTRDGLRAQKSPPPGERPGILAEPGPQRSDRTVRHFAGAGLPTLALPSLAGSAAEAVDASTLNFLLSQNLALQKKKDVEEKKKEKEVEAKAVAELAQLDAELVLVGYSASPTTAALHLRRRFCGPSRGDGSRSRRRGRGRGRRGEGGRRQQWHVPDWFSWWYAVPSFVDRPSFSAFSASWSVWSRKTVFNGSFVYGWFCCLRCTSRCVPSFVSRPSLDCCEIFVFQRNAWIDSGYMFASVYGSRSYSVQCLDRQWIHICVS